jgi:hypothetical protein
MISGGLPLFRCLSRHTNSRHEPNSSGHDTGETRECGEQINHAVGPRGSSTPHHGLADANQFSRACTIPSYQRHLQIKSARLISPSIPLSTIRQSRSLQAAQRGLAVADARYNSRLTHQSTSANILGLSDILRIAFSPRTALRKSRRPLRSTDGIARNEDLVYIAVSSCHYIQSPSLVPSLHQTQPPLIFIMANAFALVGAVIALIGSAHALPQLLGLPIRMYLPTAADRRRY